MLPKRLISSGLLILTLLTLAACHDSSSHTTHSSNHASSSSSINGNAPEAKTTAKTFTVPAADSKSPKYQKNGVLSLPGEFSYDKVGTKLTLAQSRAQSKTATAKGLAITIKKSKIIKNVAKTQQAKAMAAEAFNDQAMPNPYITVQLTFTVQNKHQQPAVLDDIKQVTLSTGATVTSLSGLSDSSAGVPIQADSQKTFTAMILAGKTAPNWLRVQFSGSFNQSGTQLSPAPQAIQIAI